MNTIYKVNKKLIIKRSDDKSNNEKEVYKEHFWYNLCEQKDIRKFENLNIEESNESYEYRDICFEKENNHLFLSFTNNKELFKVKLKIEGNQINNSFVPISFYTNESTLLILDKNLHIYSGTIQTLANLGTNKRSKQQNTINLEIIKHTDFTWNTLNEILYSKFIELNDNNIICVLITKTNIKAMMINNKEVVEKELFILTECDKNDKEFKIIKVGESEVKIECFEVVYLLYINKKHKMKLIQLLELNNKRNTIFELRKVYDVEPLVTLDHSNKVTFHYCNHFKTLFYYDNELKGIIFDDNTVPFYYKHSKWDHLEFLQCYEVNNKHILIGRLNEQKVGYAYYETKGDGALFAIFRYLKDYKIQEVVREIEIETKSPITGSVLVNDDTLAFINGGSIYLFRIEGDNLVNIEMWEKDYTWENEPKGVVIKMFEEEYEDAYTFSSTEQQAEEDRVEENENEQEGNSTEPENEDEEDEEDHNDDDEEFDDDEDEDTNYDGVIYTKIGCFRNEVLVIGIDDVLSSYPVTNYKLGIPKHLVFKTRVIDMHVNNETIYVLLNPGDNVRVLFNVSGDFGKEIKLERPITKLSEKDNRMFGISPEGAIVYIN